LSHCCGKHRRDDSSRSLYSRSSELQRAQCWASMLFRLSQAVYVCSFNRGCSLYARARTATDGVTVGYYVTLRFRFYLFFCERCCSTRMPRERYLHFLRALSSECDSIASSIYAVLHEHKYACEVYRSIADRRRQTLSAHRVGWNASLPILVIGLRYFRATTRRAFGF
jgi:hypothetical protein